MDATRALDLADAIRGLVWPNPPVGCVIVDANSAVAEAATSPGGRPHAERRALELAGAQAYGATLYVTLEPCCHWGRTTPCADAIAAAGIRRVVCAIQDPDPRVNGGGFRKQRNAGIDVNVGLGAGRARVLMSGFLHRVHTGFPKVLTVESAAELPFGIDAAIRSDFGKVILRCPQRFGQNEVVLNYTNAEDLLSELGQRGLTSVGISLDDPVLSAILDAQQRALLSKGRASVKA